MSLPEHKPHKEENTEAWLMSYADMITLLLCFFIIFVSVSEPKKDKLRAIAEGMQSKFGVIDMSTPFQGTFRSLQATVEGHAMLKDVAIEKTELSIEMELSTVAFYKADSAEFNEDKMPVLKEMTDALRQIDFLDYRITIEGHTSDAPVNPLYPSHWELSTARAARMVRFMAEQGIKPEKMRIVGFGDTQPKVPNLDGSGHAIIENRNKNERIVIKVERVM